MGRRKRQNPRDRKLRTIEHFAITQPDEVRVIEAPPAYEAPEGRRWVPRLTWRPTEEHDFDLDYFASMVDRPFNRDVVNFFDANMFLAPTDDRLWKAMLSRPGRLAIAEPILHELRFWLNDSPTFNSLAHEAISDELRNHSSAVICDDLPPKFTPARTALDYYVQLLGIRKRGYEYTEELLKRNGFTDIDRQTASNACASILGTRTQRLARERREIDEALNLNDEQLVVRALQWSLLHGREVTIWTRDEGVLEQFYKAVWLLDTHYRSWLLGYRFNQNPTEFYTRDVSATDCSTESGRRTFLELFADVPMTLIKLDSATLKELLFDDYRMISWHCCFLRENRLTQLSFSADDTMQRVFEVKGCTGGLSSGLFDPRNIHIWLGPLVNEFGRFGAIALDRGLPFDSGHIAGLDIMLSLHSREGMSHTTYEREN
jgi:hypothetical protein